MNLKIIFQLIKGSGKTLAFSVPLVQKILASKSSSSSLPRAVVLSPTRELGLQIYEQVQKLTKNTKVRSLAVYGGTSYTPQERALRNGIDILIGTPGRVMDHIEKKNLDLSKVEMFGKISFFFFLTLFSSFSFLLLDWTFNGINKIK